MLFLTNRSTPFFDTSGTSIKYVKSAAVPPFSNFWSAKIRKQTKKKAKKNEFEEKSREKKIQKRFYKLLFVT